MKKRLVILLLLPLAGLKAQHQADYSQYMFNTLLFNPAYAGSSEALNLTGLYRKQWVGLNGAPVTISFGAHSQLKNKSLNLGFITQSESIGIYSSTRVAGIYAFRFRLGAGFLALGLQGGINVQSSSWNLIKTTEEQDPGFMLSNERKIAAAASFGLYYHNSDFYIGASIPELLDDNSAIHHALNLHTGYVISLGENFHVKPAAMLRYLQASPLSVNTTLTGYWKDLIGIGAGYTFKNSFIVLGDIKVNDQFRFGYAYTRPFNELKTYTSGSHEVMLRYLFSYKSKAISARYF